MACVDPHLNDIGTIFELTIKDCGVIVDISSNSALEVIFEKPDKTILSRVGVLSTDGTDGKLQYVTIAGDLDLEKTWKIQARVTLPTGTWSSEINKFVVRGNLD